MKKIIVKIATVVIVLGLVGGIIYWKSLPEEDVSIETVASRIMCKSISLVKQISS